MITDYNASRRISDSTCRQVSGEARGRRAVDHAVVVGQRQRQHQARHELPSCYTGFMLDRDTPRIATSGALMMGVKAVPPMPPRLEIEKQPPCMSAAVIFFSLRAR